MGSKWQRAIGLLVVGVGMLADLQMAVAQSASPLQLLDSTVPQAMLTDIDPQGRIVFQLPQEQKLAAPAEIVLWNRAKTVSSQASIALMDGSWLSGRIEWKTDNSLVLVSDWFESLELQLDQVRAIVLQGSPSVRQTIELQTQILLHSGASDKVWKKRGQPVAGVVKSKLIQPKITGGANRIAWMLKPEKSDESVALAEDDVSGIALSPVLRTALPEDSERLSVTLVDASRLKVQTLKRLDDGRVELQLDAKTKLITLDTAEEFVSAVIELAGHSRKAQWLSDIEPARYRLLESSSRVPWPLGRNRDLFGKRLYAGELPIDKSLVIHSPAQVAYRWDGQSGKFLASIALWSEATAGSLPPAPGSVKCQVLLGKNNQLTSAFQSQVLKTSDAPIDVRIDVTGAQLIVLLVEATEDGTPGDHVLWRDARIVGGK